MKKLISTSLFFFAILTAQAAHDTDVFRNQAIEITRNLANQVGLNESEFIQVKNYTLEKLAATAEIKEMYRYKPELMHRKLNEVETAYTHNVQSLFSNRQIDNYLTINNRANSAPILLSVHQE